MQSPVTAFLLAGGKSTRMGSDKAFVQLNGQTLLERTLRALRTVTQDVMIVGATSKFAKYAPVAEDIFPERGPLGGIHAALTTTATDLNLVLAVDLPLVETTFLRFLCARAQQTETMVVAPFAAGGWQPLCAVYRKEFGALAGAALAAGRNKIDSLFSQVPVTAVEEPDILQAGFSLDMFRNVNTLEELNDASASCNIS